MQKHKEWLWFAEVDLMAAQDLLTSRRPNVGPIVYHAQQCAEKALKAYLVLIENDVPFTHDLVTLLLACSKYDPEFRQLRTIATELSPFATKSRYPDDHFSWPDLSVAKYSVKQAEELFNFVSAKLEKS